ncbi:MAG: hypothetical protein KAR01_09425 [Desulfocapsa sp.]|nr:hypothetical protein [Desulfocapsa sp.]
MKKNHLLIVIAAISLMLSGCSTLNCTRLEGLVGGDVNLISLSNKITDDLTESAMPPLMPRHPEDAILTSTFVDLDQLERTSRLGRQLQSHIGARLVQLGYTVKEVNLRHTMQMTPGDGERILSRVLSEITPEQSVQAILAGTYSINNRTLYLTAKLINPTNRNIISAQSYKLCMDDSLLSTFGLMRQSHIKSDEIQPPSESIINKIFY